MEPVNPYAAPRETSGAGVGQGAEQPLSVLAALNSGTALYVRRFPTLAAITLCVWIPAEMFVSYQEYFVLDPDDVLGAFRWSMLADGFVGIIAIGGTISVGAAALRGEHRGWLDGLGDGVLGWPRLFAARFVGGLVLLFAALLFVIPALYLGARYSLSDCAAILERRGGPKAISRSMELTRGRFLIFLGLCAITVVPILLTSFVIYMPLAFYPQYAHWLLSAALSCGIDLLVPWMTMVFVAAYVQCRAEESRAEAPVAADIALPATDADPHQT